MQVPGFYHTTAEILQKLQDLTKTCHELRQVSATSIHAFYLESSSPKTAFLLFGEHPREMISPELGLHVVEEICAKKLRVLDKTSIFIVVNASPIGRSRVENGEYCLRANENGVDINRNWAAFWEKEDCGKANNCPGPYPFSETQTIEIRDLLEEAQAELFLSVHSGVYSMFFPYVYDYLSIPENDEKRMMEVLDTINQEFELAKKVGPGAEALKYIAPGNCLDYAYSVDKVPYTYAWEIYQGESEKTSTSFLQITNSLENDECLEFFNPLEKEIYEDILWRWSRALERMIEIIYG